MLRRGHVLEIAVGTGRNIDLRVGDAQALDLVRAIQRVLDPLSVRLHANHLLRDPLDHLEAVGFAVERVERSKLGNMERVVARKPAATGAGLTP